MSHTSPPTDVTLPSRRSAALIFVSISSILLQACAHEGQTPARVRAPVQPSAPQMCTLWQRGGETPLREIPCRNLDSDLDGVDDAVDLCPMLQEIENGIADGDGCPDPDPDRDGYADFEDACPQLAGVAPDGCPLVDKDRDFIADHLDACPNQPEDIDGEDDGDGCPEGIFRQRYARALTEQIWLAEKLEVRAGSVKLSRQGRTDFKRLKEQLSRNVDAVRKIRVVAYASVLETARGRAKRLAKRRVRRIRSKLRKMGFPKDVFSYSVYPLKNGGERVGRVEVTVLVPLALSLDELNAPSVSPSSAQWIRPVTYSDEATEAPSPKPAPAPSTSDSGETMGREDNGRLWGTKTADKKRKRTEAKKRVSNRHVNPLSAEDDSSRELRAGQEVEKGRRADTDTGPAPASELSQEQEASATPAQVTPDHPDEEPDTDQAQTVVGEEVERVTPRRASLLFDDDELPDEDPRDRKELSAPVPLAKTRIDLSKLDDSDEDILLFEDDENGEELDLPEGDAADLEVLFFEEPQTPDASDWEAPSAN